MNHYVYLITFNDGMKYVGAHSTKLDPEIDATYLGSGRALPDRDFTTCNKTILQTFQTRKEAIAYEIEFIENHDCVKSDEWYNQRLHNYDKHGRNIFSCAGTYHTANKLRGRSKDSHEYLKVKGQTFSSRYGNNRSPAMLAADKIRAEKSKGSNPSKAHHGTDNSAFKPWYYITPQGDYVEVHDKTKIELAESLGFTPRQIGHGFHYTNEHKVSKTKPRKGWTFGNLPRPNSEES